METCRLCRARLFDGATFCARCLAPITPSDEELGEALVNVEAAGGRWRAPPTPVDAWAPESRLTAPAPPKVHSHWKGGVLSFGPATKIAITAVMVGVPILAWKMLGLWSIEFDAVWAAFVVPRVLRDVWRRARVR